jgi:hypothetical protein
MVMGGFGQGVVRMRRFIKMRIVRMSAPDDTLPNYFTICQNHEN